MNIKIFLGRIFNFKNVKTAALALAGIAVFLLAVSYGLSWYGEYSFNKELQAIKKETERPYLEDTYGGKTPKETLELFIAAVEKDDFDLASKYFVISKQEEWKDGLEKAKEKDTLSWLLDKLHHMEDIGAINPDHFQMGAKNEKGVFMVFINFIKYPRGIWKIQEI